MSPRRAISVTALAALLVAGCADAGEDPGAASSPSTVAGATASPVPTSSPTAASASPSDPSPPPSPSPTATGPAAAADGCPPPAGQRATLPAGVDEGALPTTSNEILTESPRGRPIEVALVTFEGSPAADDITAAVRAEVEDTVAAWDEALGPPEQDEADRPAPELQLEVTVTRLGARLVSLELDGYRYLGGASGDAVADAWTFSTATGHQLGLADVGLDGPCRDELGQLAADALVDEGVGMFEEGEAALRRGEVALERWAVTDESLRIHFPEYEIAPGAAGAPVADLLLQELHAVTGSPLGGGG